jgi:hypothetical protein
LKLADVTLSIVPAVLTIKLISGCSAMSLMVLISGRLIGVSEESGRVGLDEDESGQRPYASDYSVR